MIVKYKLMNPKRNPSFPYDRVYKFCGVMGVYTDLRHNDWVIVCGNGKHCLPREDIIIISIEREKPNDV